MEWKIVIDIGTGGVHVASIDETLLVVCIKYEKIIYKTTKWNGGKELDPDELYATIIRLVAKVIAETGYCMGNCRGIVITGQRHGAVFCDGDVTPLLCCPNVDGRASAEAKEVGDLYGDKVFEITSRWPASYFPAMRLMWMRKHLPNLYEQVKYVLMLNEWTAWKLTGEITSEPTNAVETLFFDIREMCWSNELRNLFDLDALHENELIPSGRRAGFLFSEIAHLLGLSGRVPVYLAPSDTQSAAIGCGANRPGDIVVVNGSTTPIVCVSSKFLSDSTKSAWLTPYFDGLWLIEANANRSGIIFRELVDFCVDFVDEIVKKIGLTTDRDALRGEIMSISEEEGDAIGYWGPRISNVRLPAICGTAMLCDTEANPFASVIPSFIDNLAFAVYANIELASSMLNKNNNNIWLTGGGSRNNRFCSIVATLSRNKNVARTLTSETTMLGAAAAVAIINRENAVDVACIEEKLRKNTEKIIPADDPDILSRRYLLWREYYDQIAEFHKRRTT